MIFFVIISRMLTDDVQLPIGIFDQVLLGDGAVAQGMAAPFVVNKLIFPRKGSLTLSMAALEEAALEEAASKSEYDQKLFTADHIKRTLMNKGMQMTRVFDIDRLEDSASTTYVVFCELNEDFVSRKYTNRVSSTQHVVLIRNGFIHCVYLREFNRPLKLSVHKHLFITSNDFGTNNTRNSYIKYIKSAYVIAYKSAYVIA